MTTLLHPFTHSPQRLLSHERLKAFPMAIGMSVRVDGEAGKRDVNLHDEVRGREVNGMPE